MSTPRGRVPRRPTPAPRPYPHGMVRTCLTGTSRRRLGSGRSKGATRDRYRHRPPQRPPRGPHGRRTACCCCRSGPPRLGPVSRRLVAAPRRRAGCRRGRPAPLDASSAAPAGARGRAVAGLPRRRPAVHRRRRCGSSSRWSLLVLAIVLWWGISAHWAIPLVWLGSAVGVGAARRRPAAVRRPRHDVAVGDPGRLRPGRRRPSARPWSRHRAHATAASWPRSPSSTPTSPSATLAAPANADPNDPTDFDAELLGWVYDLALQPLDEFNGFDWGEQIHGPTCVRYQLNMLGYGLAALRRQPAAELPRSRSRRRWPT